MGRLAIFGAGGMGRELADIALRRWDSSQLVFVVDSPGDAVEGIQLIAPTELREDDHLCLAIGDPQARKALAKRFHQRAFGSILAETSRVSRSATLGPGAVICDFVAINSNARIGSHFQCNLMAHVSHDCIIGDFVTLSPRVSCNGWVEIGDEVFVGAGAVIRNGTSKRRLTIGRGATVGMGAIVTRDVPQGATVYGNPARIVS